MPVFSSPWFRLSPAALVLALLPLAGLAEPLAVVDSEGFGAPLTALTLDLPAGWAGTGKVIWTKPCSGNELFEFSVSAASADGQSGLRMKPGHQVQWADTTVDASVDPMVAQMALAQAEALKNQMRTQFRGSNCHFGKLGGTEAEVTQALIRALVLPDLPAGARVTALQPNAAMLASYKGGLLPAAPGFVSRYDAQVVDLAFDGPNGPMLERLWLSWSQFGTDPDAPAPPGFPAMQFQTVIVDTISFVYAPANRPGDIAAGTAAITSVKADLAWIEAVRKVQAQIAAQRQQTQKDRSDAFDRQNKAFLDTILQ